MRAEWEQINLQTEPRLLVGWRGARRRLGAERVKLHAEVYDELAELCAPALVTVRTGSERPYETFAQLDEGEYFWFDHSHLPRHPPVRPSKQTENAEVPNLEDDTADLVRLVTDSGWTR